MEFQDAPSQSGQLFFLSDVGLLSLGIFFHVCILNRREVDVERSILTHIIMFAGVSVCVRRC